MSIRSWTYPELCAQCDTAYWEWSTSACKVCKEQWKKAGTAAPFLEAGRRAGFHRNIWRTEVQISSTDQYFLLQNSSGALWSRPVKTSAPEQLSERSFWSAGSERDYEWAKLWDFSPGKVFPEGRRSWVLQKSRNWGGKTFFLWDIRASFLYSCSKQSPQIF